VRRYRVALPLMALISAAGITNAQETQTEKTDFGQREFQTTCAVCHGQEGRGDGPYASMLKTPVPDLTMLSQRNGGTFPFQRVYDMIDGTVMTSGHGTRRMPIWGQVYTFRTDENYYWGASPLHAQPFVRARILALTEYIARLQVGREEGK
jgi:mono/diheme cytochrome c family protein